MTAKAAKRVTDAHVNARLGVRAAARALGVPNGEVRAAIDTATKLEHLPATDAAVRDGRLSAREAQMIADAATFNRAAEQDLLDTADGGLVRLRDACVAARAAVEDPSERSQRQRKLREWRMWTDTDGMLAGRFRFMPETGGFLKTAIEAAQQRIYRRRKAAAHESLDAYAADAVVQFILGDHTDSATKGVDATVHILVDHGTLMCGGTADGEVCEIPGVGPVDVNWVKELLGSAFLTVVIKKGKDILTVAHLGRHVPRKSRRRYS